MRIHPSAIVECGATLGEDVEIGPGVVIGPHVTMGTGCVIHANAVITGFTTLGSGNVVGYCSVIGSEPQDLSYDPTSVTRVEIGSNNTIREHCTIHRGTKPASATVIGDHNFLMANAHVGHNARVGSHVILANNVLLGGYAEVGDRAFLGGGCGVHQFTRIGSTSVMQGNSGFSKDAPPFTIGSRINVISGLNVVGLRRAQLTPEQRAEIKEAFTLLYRSGKNVTQALEAAAEREWGAEATAFFDFVRTAKRGVAGLHRRSAID